MRLQKPVWIWVMMIALLCFGRPSSAQVGDGWIRDKPSVVLHHAAHGRLYIERRVPGHFDDGLAHYDTDGVVETFILHKAASNRVEIRVNNNYDRGMRQFEGSVWIDAPTGNESIMQIFGGSAHATAAMFRAGFNANGGEIRHGSRQTIASGIYGKWVRLNVIHDADIGMVSAYVDGKFAGRWKDDGYATHYFKYGAYGTHDDVHPAVVKWKDVSFYYR
ncbi:MAG: C-terminal target protein [Herminiimonas sp.]|nr:C-terminal target protein [Herminiimonas sp.]